MLITFSGLDGAGKSTLIAWLRKALEERGHSVLVLHLNDDVGVYAYVRAARNWLLRLLGRPAPLPRPAARDTARGTRKIRNALVWNATLRCCIYPIDLLVFALQRF